MKSKILLSLLFFLGIFFSCKKSNNSIVPPAAGPGSKYTAQLAKTWHWNVFYQIVPLRVPHTDTDYSYKENDPITVINDSSIVFQSYVLYLGSFDSIRKNIAFYDANYDVYSGGVILIYGYSDSTVSCTIHIHDGISSDKYYQYTSL